MDLKAFKAKARKIFNFKKMVLLATCLIAMDTAYSYHDYCPVDNGLIPCTMAFAALSGIGLALPISVIRPQFQLSIGVYNCATFIQNILKLYFVEPNYQPVLWSLRHYCPYEFHLAAIVFSMAVFICWAIRTVTLLKFIRHKRTVTEIVKND